MSATLPLIVVDAIGSALRQIGADPALPLQPTDVGAVADALGPRVRDDPRFQEVAAELEHLANQEPWYRSRVTWGALITFAAAVAGAMGLTVEGADADAAVTVLTAGGALFGAVVTLYGRWIARRPIAY